MNIEYEAKFLNVDKEDMRHRLEGGQYRRCHPKAAEGFRAIISDNQKKKGSFPK